jgi:hypothetical protein
VRRFVLLCWRAADAALPTLFSRPASQRDCVGHRLAG